MKISSNIPIPSRLFQTGQSHELRTAIAKMKVGQSFVWHENKHPYHWAEKLGRRVVTRKISGVGYRVWRSK